MKNKKLFAILTLVCFMFTFMPVAAMADGSAITTAEELQAAINAANNGDTITLAPGKYKMPSSETTANITITGTTNTVIDVTMGAYLDKATLTFEGVSFKVGTGKANGNGSDYAALYSPNVIYKNCTFKGPMRVGRDGAKFIGCEFTELGNDYIWTYGNDVTFEECTFNTDGKAILIYSDGGAEVSQVSVKKCTFNATGGAKAGAIANQNCAAIEIHNYGNGVNLTTADNTYDANFSGEWRIKTYETGKPGIFVNSIEYTTIAIDGKTMTIDNDKNVTVLEPVAKVGNKLYTSLAEAVAEADGKTVTLLKDVTETQITIPSGKDITIVGATPATYFEGQFKVSGTLRLENITIKDPTTAVAGEVSQYSKSAIALVNSGDVYCDNVVFEQDLTDGSAITAWWSTGDGANITVNNCTFNSNGQRPIRSDACVTVENTTFNDPYRYAVQMTSKSSTMDADAEAYVNFNKNTINAGNSSRKTVVYGIQLEGETYGNGNLTINGSGNKIVLGSTGKTSAMYYCECGKNDHSTIIWNTEVAPVHENSTTYSVTWNIDGVITIETVEAGAEIKLPTEPTKSGYTFTGWNGYTKGMTMPEKDVTFTATWTENSTPSAPPTSSSSGGGFSGKYNYAVNVSATGADVTLSDNYAVAGETVTITVDPDMGKQVDEVIVTDADGDVISVTKVGDNKYTFVMPAGKVNVSVTTEAADYDQRIVMQINNKNIVNNNKTITNDVAPVIVGDRTLVPVRIVTELLGGTADWDEAARTVTLTIDGKVLKLVIDQPIPGFGTSATIINDRTYVPVRYVLENLGAEVTWIAETQQIIIEK